MCLSLEVEQAWLDQIHYCNWSVWMCVCLRDCKAVVCAAAIAKSILSHWFFLSLVLKNCFSSAVIHPRWPSTKAAALFYQATICKWLRGWKWDLRRLFKWPRFCSNLFPSAPPSCQKQRITNPFQNPGAGGSKEASLEQVGCQKSQLAGSALRNLVQQRPIKLLRLGTVMTGGPPPRELNDRNSVVGKKIYQLTLDFFCHSLTCYCSWVDLSNNTANYLPCYLKFLLTFQITQQISCCTAPCVSSPNTSNIYSLL